MSTGAAPLARRRCVGVALPASFFRRETEIVARELLGSVLWCDSDMGVTAGRIVETEAYLGEHDPACHAAVAGETSRTRSLYGKAGIAYVYFIYGVHWCFNAVTRAKGYPSAVLVRALEPLEGVELMRARRRFPGADRDLANGPGKLCEALGISRAHDGVALDRPPLVIRRGAEVPDSSVTVLPRVGISRAADWPLRWFVTDSEFVSGARRTARR